LRLSNRTGLGESSAVGGAAGAAAGAQLPPSDAFRPERPRQWRGDDDARQLVAPFGRRLGQAVAASIATGRQVTM
jgi:hypothetical protein